MTKVRAKRLGWNEKTSITDVDDLDPYDYANDDLEGELQKIEVNTGSLQYTNFLVDGQVADGSTIEEIDEDAVTAAVDDTRTVTSPQAGAMIALVPTQSDVDRLILPGGESAEELHLTLFFLGNAESYDMTTRNRLADAIEDLVAARGFTGPAIGIGFGVNYWNPSSDDPAWVIAVGDPPEGESIVDIHGLVEEAALTAGLPLPLPEQHSPWVPHVTIAYGKNDILVEMEQRLGTIAFDRIRLAFGGEYHDVMLTGERATLTAS